AAALLLAALAVWRAVGSQAPQPFVPVAVASPTAVGSPETKPSPAVSPRQGRAVQAVRVEGARATNLTVSEQTRTARLEGAVPVGGPPSYGAVIRTADGREVWQVKDVVPASYGAPLALDVPAERLETADYRLSVVGEDVREEGAATTAPL